MRNFFSFIFHELRVLFLSPASCVATVLFLAIMVLFYLLILKNFSQAPQKSLTTIEFFKVFWLPLFFIIPLLTIKTIVEERISGTLGSLMTTSKSSFSVVFSKFFAAYLLYLILWELTLGFPFTLHQYLLADDSLNSILLCSASIFGGYLFIAVSSTFYIALSIFSISFTRSQLIAGTVTFNVPFLFLFGTCLLLELSFLDLPWLSTTNLTIIDYFQKFEHLEDFSRGIADSRPLFFYIRSAL